MAKSPRINTHLYSASIIRNIVPVCIASFSALGSLLLLFVWGFWGFKFSAVRDNSCALQVSQTCALGQYPKGGLSSVPAHSDAL